MAKRYVILEEDTEKGTHTEVGRADKVVLDESGQAVAEGYHDSHTPSRSVPRKDPNVSDPSYRPVQVPAGKDQIITITIQVAPADAHHHNHSRGGCSDCEKARHQKATLSSEAEKEFSQEKRGWKLFKDGNQ